MKKISAVMRRRMLLDLEEKGLSDKDLKEKYGIVDNRTLRKHLGLAEREREAREARIKILADNQASHLSEIRRTIEQWKSSLETPSFNAVSLETASRPTASLEHNPLFGSLREHLPFATLWRDYTTWTEKVENYIDSCKKLLEETRKEAEDSPELEINRIANDVGRVKIAGADFTGPLREVMRVYKDKAESRLKALSDEIKALGDKLGDSLQEILLRRDYIVYACRLCPGQARLLR
jgi:hypothetical protein